MEDPQVEIYVLIETSWHHALSIPPGECARFTCRPLKWFRFLAGVLMGSRGELSGGPRGQPLDYDEVPENLAGKYYFTPDGPPLLIDARALDGRTTDSDKSISSAHGDFCDGLVERDGTCVFTDSPVHQCGACHILPHSKGDEYIARVSKQRGSPEDYISEINDPRNGLLLFGAFDKLLENGSIAFLLTPNFALSEVDVPPAPGSPQVETGGRFTLHWFSDHLSWLAQQLPPNSDARRPSNLSSWPRAHIVNFHYGCTAFAHWGRPAFKSFLENATKEYFYPPRHYAEEELTEHARGMKPGQQNATQATRIRRRNKPAPSDPSKKTPVDVMDLVLMLWSCAPKKDPGTGVMESQTGPNEKTQRWLEDLASTDDYIDPNV
ncbi:hypothetical protein BOTBODRAFT_52414 [Botryobasidium botryosum FD-172 SS1]|uniref:HNH nuclease domain-containing protein n=1 Tax=Botryobasidium botryosum (strain FD-172 SS1) TaxID=930990 RepID=A0A067N3N8_BOTB1|nr:hypothetical protein BOTBODRAFT_52414 [Botryobasidium botryosum FD-172 SS1]